MSEENTGAEAPSETATPSADIAGNATSSGTVDASNEGAIEALADAEAVEADGGNVDWSREVEVTIDGETRMIPMSEMRDNYQLRTASHKRMQEAANMRKQVNTILETMKTPEGMREVAKMMGVPVADLGKVFTEEQRKLEAMDPADRRALELDQRERSIAEREHRAQQAREQQRLSIETRNAQERWVNDFKSAGSAAGVEVTETVIAELATIVGDALDSGYTQVTAGDAIKLWQEQERERRQRYLKGLGVDDLSPAQIAELRDARVEKAKQIKSRPKPTTGKPHKPAGRKRTRIEHIGNIHDFFSKPAGSE